MPSKKSSQPKAGRPYMPGYGIVGPRKGRLLPWRWATERLRKAHNYWISTCRPGSSKSNDAGRPHAMPVWGVWLDGAFYFSTGRESRKARNLSKNPRCVVCPEGASEAVILEGVAQEVTDAAKIREAAKLYNAKYPFELDPSLGPIFAVRPRVVFGQIERANLFTKTATRWRFD